MERGKNSSFPEMWCIRKNNFKKSLAEVVRLSRKISLPRWLSGQESTCQCRRHKRHQFNPWVRKIPWKRKWQPTPVFLPGKSHGQKSLVDYSSWGHKESDMTEQLSTNPCFPTAMQSWSLWQRPTKLKALPLWPFMRSLSIPGLKASHPLFKITRSPR